MPTFKRPADSRKTSMNFYVFQLQFSWVDIRRSVIGSLVDTWPESNWTVSRKAGVKWHVINVQFNGSTWAKMWSKWLDVCTTPLTWNFVSKSKIKLMQPIMKWSKEKINDLVGRASRLTIRNSVILIWLEVKWINYKDTDEVLGPRAVKIRDLKISVYR